MSNIQVQIEQVWKVEQEILDVVHEICKKNNLRYSLAFGTLIGAVRHGGFIPWDDDIDLFMPREDYEKLLLIWDSVAPKGYLIQNKRTHPDFTQNFTKIRKDKTTFIQDEIEKTKNYHTGIFVDIFPVDRVAPKGFRRRIQYVASALNLLCARGHSSGSKGLIGLIEKAILGLPQKTQIRIYNTTERLISRWNSNPGLAWYSPNTIDVCKRYFDTDMFESIIDIDFNNQKYCCVKNYKKLLTKIYGDYMRLPPLEDRIWKHHPILIDFNRNYAEIIMDQKNKQEAIK